MPCCGCVARPYIGSIEVSVEMAAKLGTKHGVTVDEVREACDDHDVQTRWHFDARYGWRLLVRGRTVRGRRLKVILQPVDPAGGTWRLRTAFAEA